MAVAFNSYEGILLFICHGLCNNTLTVLFHRVQFNRAYQAEQEFVVSLGNTQIEKLGEIPSIQKPSLLKANADEVTIENDEKLAEEEEEESSQKEEDTDESDEKPKKKRRKGIMNK